jgi:vancomycin permeability regulator SanA
VLSKETVSFSPSKKSQVINVLLPADQVGVALFTAKITSNENEKNTYNNAKKFAVEVIDQKT